MRPVRDSGKKDFQDSDGGWPIDLLVQSREGKLRGPVDGDERMELALMGAHVGDVDVDEADRVGPKRAFGCVLTFDIRQAGDPTTLQTPMQGRAYEVRDRDLQGVEAIAERQ